MDKIFDVYLYKADTPDSEAHAELKLPAAPYELLDALDKLRLSDGERMCCEILEYTDFEYLFSTLDGNITLYETNALAQQLSQLDEHQRTVFEGLIKMEGTDAAISPQRVIDLAYSTDCCYVADEAANDEKLGRFYAENGFVPGVERIPDDLFEMLDFEQIGRTFRQNEGGVFTDGGYVVKHTNELHEVYATLDLKPAEPDYTMLLEVTHNSQTALLKLPADVGELEAVPQMLDEPDWLDLSWRCLDCKIPLLTETIAGSEDGINFLNHMAQRLADMEPKTLNAYKALLSAADCKTLQQAEQLMDTLDQYIFSPQFSSPIELAMGELSVILCESDAERITPHLNLYQYGQALIQRCGGMLTDYGLIERKDGQPVQVMETEPQPQQGGMEMR